MFRSLLIISFIGAIHLNAQEYYVSTSGSDAENGTSIESAWESLQHAMDVAVPGSVVHVLEGVYNEKCYMNVDGVPGQFIEFRNYDGADVIIDGSGLADIALLELYDANFIRVRGLQFRNNIQLDAIGLLIEGYSSNIEIIDCKFSNIHFSENEFTPVSAQTNSQPIIVYGNEDQSISNLLFRGNEIFNCRTGYSEAFAINGNVDGFELINNHIHDVSNIGIDIIGHEGTCSDPILDQARNGLIQSNIANNCLSPYASAAGIYVDGGKGLIIERNQVYNNQWGIEIGCENVGKTSSGIQIRNNFIYGNNLAGLAIGGYDYPNGSGSVVNCTIRNNSFFSNDGDGDYTGEMAISYVENTSITANIFHVSNVGNTLYYLDEAVPLPIGLTLNNNLWYSVSGPEDVSVSYYGISYSNFTAYQAGTSQEENSIFANPLYINSEINNADLHLQENSPAIDAGDSAFIPADGETDIDGDNRLVGTIDLGADEFSGVNSTQNSVQAEFKVYPNPASSSFRIVLNNNEQTRLTVNDISGKTVLSENIQPGTNYIDVSSLRSGLYFISANQLIARLIVE